jgi:hypothetical protein
MDNHQLNTDVAAQLLNLGGQMSQQFASQALSLMLKVNPQSCEKNSRNLLRLVSPKRAGCRRTE